jgi:hypothetical protein
MKFTNRVVPGLVVCLLAGCTTARVNFIIPASPMTDFNDKGISFRIPRSQISIARKSGSTAGIFVDTVIDPVQTTAPTLLPLNEKSNYYYTLDYTAPEPTGFTKDNFDKLITSGSLGAWPIPTCGTATVTLYVLDNTVTLPDFTVTAVPTELAYPSAAGQKAMTASTLYRATGVDNLGSTTALKITYLSNTKLIASVGTTVTDHVVDDIKTITAVATAAASFVTLSAKLPEPKTLDQTDVLHAKANFTLRVADYRVLESMSLPSNGSITMNPVCGADRTDAGTGGPAAIANDLTQIMNSVQSSYQAWTKPPAPTTPAKPK